MSAPRVVAGVLEGVDAEGVATLSLDVDPDTGEAAVITAALPVLEVGSVAFALIGDHGAVIIPASLAGVRVEFATYADLRDGIVVGGTTRGSNDAND